MPKFIEGDTGFSREHAFKAKRRRSNTKGGFHHSRVVKYKNDIAASIAEADISEYFGEPSQAFFTEQPEIYATVATDIFVSETFTPKAKLESELPAVIRAKRTSGINEILENPGRRRSPNTRDNLAAFLSKNWDRIRRFSRTSENKGKLHPAIKRLLDF